MKTIEGTVNAFEGKVVQMVEDVVIVAAVFAALGFIWAGLTNTSGPRFREIKQRQLERQRDKTLH